MSKLDIRNALTSHIANGNIKLPLKLLITILRNHIDQKNKAILLSQRLKTLSNDIKKGIISSADLSLERNKISSNLVMLIEEVHENINFTSLINPDVELSILKHSNNEIILEILEDRLDESIVSIEELCIQLGDRSPKYNWENHFTIQVKSIRKKWNEKRFQVAIIALVKSGKSTLLNALIGNEYLPSASEPETMQSINIRHNPKLDTGSLFIPLKNKEYNGPNQIREEIRKLNDKKRKNTATTINSEMILEVNIEALNDKRIEGYGFDILDTPGVNEADNLALQAEIEKIIKQSDAVIYLLDYTKLNTKDENEVFIKLKHWKEELFNQSSKNRLFFIVNKIDQSEKRHNKRKGLTKDKIKKYVQNLIKKATDIKIPENDIILISAERALLTKLVSNGIASNEQKADYIDFVFGEIGKEFATDSMIAESAPKLLEKYGLVELEKKVLNTIYRLRSDIFYTSLIGDLNKSTLQVVRNLEVGRATLKIDKEKIETLKIKISKVEDEMRDFLSQVKSYRDKVDKVIDFRFSEFKKNINSISSSSFLKATSIDFGNDYVNTIVNVTRLFLTSNLVSYDDERVKESLTSIHRSVMKSIENQFDLTWDLIKRELYTEFVKVATKIEVNTKPLIWKIEEVINDNLKIDLSPSEFELEKPSFNEFYYETEFNIDKIIITKENRIRNTVKGVYEVMNEYLNTDFKLRDKYIVSSKTYRNYINKITEPMIDNQTKLETKRLINKKYVEIINHSETCLMGYSNQYTTIIEREIESRNNGVTNIELRIKDMEKDFKQASKCLRQLEQVNRIYGTLS